MRAAVAHASILPSPELIGTEGYPLSGYFDTKPRLATRMESADEDIEVRALAMHGIDGLHLLVNLDLIAISNDLHERLSRAICEELEIDRARVMFSCTHTHCGPMLNEPLDCRTMFGATDAHWEAAQAYEDDLAAIVVDTACRAGLEDPIDVDVSIARVDAPIASNRRSEAGGDTTDELIDSTVSVMSVRAHDAGRLLAVVWGAACHPVVADNTQGYFNAEFPGRVAANVSRKHPNCVSMFLPGALGDQDPHSRYGTGSDAVKNIGDAYSEAIVSALDADHVLIESISSMAGAAQLAFHIPDTNEWLEYFEQVSAANSLVEPAIRSWAISQLAFLDELDEGDEMAKVGIHSWYLVPADRNCRGTTISALGAEAVVSFVHRLRDATNSTSIPWVVSIAGGTIGYLPSDSHLELATYEAGWNQELPNGTRTPGDSARSSSITAYGLPAPFEAGAQDCVLSEVISLGWAAREWSQLRA